MNNLDWGGVEDEKDKRIRELEDTLRKQKELMEILQVAIITTIIHQKNLSFWFSAENATGRGKRPTQLSPRIRRDPRSLNTFFGNLGQDGTGGALQTLSRTFITSIHASCKLGSKNLLADIKSKIINRTVLKLA